jgi:Serine/threonine protein phosphatase
MEINIHTQTDSGQQRDYNEDSILVAQLGDNKYLLAVADGMGGHTAGDIASETATEALHQAIEELEEYTEQSVTDAMITANQAVQDFASKNPDLQGMGTTLVAAVIENESMILSNIGDSRGYLIDEKIEQVTVDHSLVQELVEQGNITEQEAETHPQSNVLSQALGTDGSVEPDCYHRELGSQTLLLCSDGLTEEVTDEQIQEIINLAPDITAATERLIDQANGNGGSDNISVVLGKK